MRKLFLAVLLLWTGLLSAQVGIFPATGYGCPTYCQGFAPTNPPSGTYSWDFGDGSPTSNQVNPVHCFTTTGDYTVTLVASPFSGPPQTATAVIHVLAQPVPSFTVSTSGLIITLQNTTVSSTSVIWTVSDGASWSQNDTGNPGSITVPALGTYTVCMRVANGYGCWDTTCQTVQVDPSGIADHALHGFSLKPTLSHDAQFQLTLPSSDMPYAIRVTDLSGRLLRREERAPGTTELSMPELSPGVYFFTVDNGRQHAVQRFVIAP